MICNSIIKIISLLLIIGLNWTGILAIGQIDQTLAYFNDSEDSQSNSLVISTLDFHLYSDSDFSPLVTLNQSASRAIDVVNDGSLGFRYTVYASNFSGDMDFCNALQLTANLDSGDPEYTGNLTGFTYNTGEFADPENWQFTAFLPEDAPDALENKTCSFKFIFEGVQLGECAGFSDIEEIENTINSGQWIIIEEMKINKVYYNVDREHGREYDNEWIEVYNPNDFPVDISGWLIEDNYLSDTIPSSDPIPALGFALITATESTFDAWEIPDEVIKIVLPDGRIGNGLGNCADMLVLRNTDRSIVDQMNWGIPNQEWPNYNDDLWNPGCDNVDKGHMLGRVPNGYDTDQASDFRDLALPTVSVSYYGSTWFCGRTYTINWRAINNNGNNNELLIDIIYITDNDRNGIISDGDNVYLVEEKIGNSGSYNLHICGAYCYLGYVWVKVIAYGPENFMVNDYDIGPRVYEPPVPEDDLDAIACPFELEGEEGIPIDIPDISPVDTVTPVQNGVNLINEGEIVESDIEEVLDEEAVEEISDEVLEDGTVAEEETTEEEIPEEEIPADEPVDEPADADEETIVETNEEIIEVIEEPVIEEPVVEDPVFEDQYY